MVGVAAAIGGGLALAGGIGGSLIQAGAASDATDAQRAQFDEVQRTLAPYVQAGTRATSQLEQLVGANRAQAVADIAASEDFQGLLEQGEEAILQNAAATGGVRGGNTQGLLARFRPNLLQDFINQRYQQLAGIAQLGQASAAQQAAAGLQTGENISSGILAQGSAFAQPLNALGGLGGRLLGEGIESAFAGGGGGGGINPSNISNAEWEALASGLINPGRGF
jgi:hypothetical protein